MQTLEPFLLLYRGQPTNATIGSYVGVENFSADTPCAGKVDEGKTGFIYCLPLTKLEGASCSEMLQIIATTGQKWKFSPSVTLNPVSPQILEAVVSLDFAEDEKSEAYACIREMQSQLMEKGHFPYRTNIKDMDLYFSDEVYCSYLRQLKKIFDPQNIIAPGRYLPLEALNSPTP